MASFPTTLIIGLGGIGSEIVADVYKKFINKNPQASEKEAAAFLCFDTDENDIAKRIQVMPEAWVVKTSADKNITIGSYIDKIRESTFVEEWFDTSSKILLKATLNRGAGQIRMASRLAYMAAMESGKMGIINKTLKELLAAGKDKNKGNNIDVHIVCSLAGGTGAGSFLQMAYYLKKMLKEVYNLEAPVVTGYFLLGDILYYDDEIGFNDAQAENTRSNTYASIKELNAFITNRTENGSLGANIEFEFMLPANRKPLKQNVNLPVDYNPFDLCYLIDFHHSIHGKNLIKKENYYEQMKDYLYLNCFSPIGGNTRSKEINDIRQLIEANGRTLYSSFGVSKIIYPVDDLLYLFALTNISENLSLNWMKIDKLYEERLKEFKKKTEEGLTADKPEKGTFFMDNVELLAKNGVGKELVVFRNVYNSTQLLIDGKVTSSKAAAFVSGLDEYIKKMRDDNNRLNQSYADYYIPESFTSQNIPQNDISTIDLIETVLEELRKNTELFVENYKREGIKQAIFADADVNGYVSGEKYKLNTYILEKEAEMHPLATRYFLYDVKKTIEIVLNELKKENKNLLNAINAYEKAFDIKKGENDDYVESPIDNYNILTKNKSIWSRIKKIILRSDELKEFKEDYRVKSKNQLDRLKKYAYSRLLEEVLNGIFKEIKELIIQYEEFFKKLGDIVTSLSISYSNYAKMHSGEANPTLLYVFSTAELKQKMYEEKVAKEVSFLFPPGLSKLIYEGIYKKTEMLLNNLYKPTKDEISKETQTLLKFFEEKVILEQKKKLAVDLKNDIVDINVIDAIRYEAKLLGIDESQNLENYFAKSILLADTLGPVNIEDKRFINAWGMHPECLEPNCLTATEADKLLKASADKKMAAARLLSPYFSKHEVIRANGVFLLELDKNFPAFISKEATRYVSEKAGIYFDAYQSVLNNMLKHEEGSSTDKIISPHLDKRWHIPAFMANIGDTIQLAAEKVYVAFYFGLIHNFLTITEKSGKKYWTYMPMDTKIPIRDIKDLDGKLLLKANLNELIEKGLMVNPSIVGNILENRAKLIEEAKQAFSYANLPDARKGTSLMNAEIVKKIYSEEPLKSILKSPGVTLFTFLDLMGSDTIIGVNRDAILDTITKDIISMVSVIGGVNPITQKVCEDILEKLNKNNDNKIKAIINRNISTAF